MMSDTAFEKAWEDNKRQARRRDNARFLAGLPWNNGVISKEELVKAFVERYSMEATLQGEPEPFDEATFRELCNGGLHGME